jgi:hypothetical protein
MDDLEKRRSEFFETRIKWSPQHPGDGWVEVTPELAERLFQFELDCEETSQKIRALIEKVKSNKQARMQSK